MHEENDLTRRVVELESRLEALERWKAAVSPTDVFEARGEAALGTGSGVDSAPLENDDSALISPPVDFDLALVGRTLIVLGGAFLLRAITESGAVSPALGVSLGLAYAVTWLLIAFWPAVPRRSAIYHGLAALLAAYPLIFEAARRFDVLDAVTAALALAVVTALWATLSWKRALHGVAWVGTAGGLVVASLLMGVTGSMMPFLWYLIALGVMTAWMGYHLDWYLLRWPVALVVDAMLVVMAILVVSDRAAISPVIAIATGLAAFVAYLVSFVVRNLLRERNVVAFEVAQAIAVLVTGLGAAMWIASAKDTFEMPLAISMLAIAAACYGASFVFIPRRHTSPGSFFFYSTLALVLVLAGGALIAERVSSSILWSALALTSAYLAGKYEKAMLSVHSAIYLVAGVIGAGLVQSGLRILALEAKGDWTVAWGGAALILGASAFAAAIHPIKRGGTYSIWAAAKLVIMIVFGWTAATILMGILGSSIHASTPHQGMVAFERTAILSIFTVLAAWMARYPRLSPGRWVANILMIGLAMKLLWDDLRFGTPLTMFLSLACVGIAMIVAQRLKGAAAPIPGEERERSGAPHGPGVAEPRTVGG
ncbi:MAG: hypothetical protein ABR524_03395 [Thermoanaerobaculia bacterium]